MKTIGLIGGITWRSTVEYYRLINELVEQKMGLPHSAKILLYSIEFGELLKVQRQGLMQEVYDIISDAAVRLEKSGADMILICANTLHKAAEAVKASTRIPLIHIADETATVIKDKNMNRVGLLGTKITMEEDFYKGRLKDKFDIEVVVPDEPDRQIIHDIIYNELGAGRIKDPSRRQYLQIIEKLIENEAEGIILGCTEIPLLVGQNHCRVPVFDTTLIHARAAVRLALA